VGNKTRSKQNVYSATLICHIAAAYRLHDRGSTPGKGKRLFSTILCPDRLLGPPSLLSNVHLFSLGVKRPGCEDHHSPASSAEVKNSGAIPPLPLTYSWRDA
jgi:hypothetical protein